MKLLWLTISGVCVFAAAFLLLRGNLDAAFVVATLGVASWFLHYRSRMKEIINAADAQQRNNEEDSNED